MSSTSPSSPDFSPIFSSLDEHIEYLQRCAGGWNGYRLKRLYLINYWLYPVLELAFPHGRVIFAGENFSGKSTLLALIIPLLLEGYSRASRLDPMGESQKKLEYYVLGSKHASTPYEHTARTTYTFLEFEWCDEEHAPPAVEFHDRWVQGDRDRTRFLTLGLIFDGQQTRQPKIKTTYVILTSGARIGKDILLVSKASDAQLYPFSAAESVQRLQKEGTIYRRQPDYEADVARMLFGISDIETYHHYLSTLVLARSSHVSKTTDLNEIKRTLRASLPAISIEYSKHIVETITTMKDVQQEILLLRTVQEAVERIHQEQQKILLHTALGSGIRWMRDERQIQTENRIVAEHSPLALRAQHELEDAHNQHQYLQQQLDDLNGHLAALPPNQNEEQRVHQLLQEEKNLRALQDREVHMQKDLANLMAVQRQSEEAMDTCRRTYTQVKHTINEQYHRLLAEAIPHLFCESKTAFLAAYEHAIPTWSLENASDSQHLQHFQHQLEQLDLSQHLHWLQTLMGMHEQHDQLRAVIQDASVYEHKCLEEWEDLRRDTRRSIEDLYDQGHSMLEQLVGIERRHSIVPMDGMGPQKMERNIIPSVDSFRKHYHSLQEWLVVLSTRVKHLQGDIAQRKERVASECDDLERGVHHMQEDYRRLDERKEQLASIREFHPDLPKQNVIRRLLDQHGVACFLLYELLAFSPEIQHEGATTGMIEQILENTGLLYTLAVLPQQRTQAFEIVGQAQHALSFLTPLLAQPGAPVAGWQKLSLTSALCFDHEGALASVPDREIWKHFTLEVIDSLDHLILLNKQQSRSLSLHLGLPLWSAGLMMGHLLPEEAHYIGRKTRQKHWQQASAHLAALANQMQEDLAHQTGCWQQKELDLTQLVTDQQTLAGLAPENIPLLANNLGRCIDGAQHAFETYQKQHRKVRDNQKVSVELGHAMAQTSVDYPVLAIRKAFVGQAIQATHMTVMLSTQMIELLHKAELSYERYDRCQTEMHHIAATIEQRQQALDEATSTIRRLQTTMRELRIPVHDQQTQKRADYERQRQEIEASCHSQQERIQSTQQAQHIHSDAVRLAEDRRMSSRSSQQHEEERLAAVLSSYPAPTFAPYIRLFQANQYPRAVADLLQFYHVDPTLNQDAIDAMHNEHEKDIHAFHELVAKEKVQLDADYVPCYRDDNVQLVAFPHAGFSNAYDCLEQIKQRLVRDQNILQNEEITLFEKFLLQEMAELIRKHLLQAETWLLQMNESLRAMSIGQETFELVWTARTSFQAEDLGQHLASLHPILRKPVQILTSQQRDILRQAFKQEIEHVQELHIQGVPLTFDEMLGRIFDYRNWFVFDILLHVEGQKPQTFDNALWLTRSTFERSLALYIPLCASLSLFHKNAHPGAPKLIALDEAFEDASQKNIREMFHFLVRQGFQWILSSPRLQHAGTQTPACIRYLLRQDKQTQIAAVLSASCWQYQTQTNFALPSSLEGIERDHEHEPE